MLYNVVILKRAYSQFQSICDYLVAEFGERTVNAFEIEVEQCVATLRKYPESGHPEPIESKYFYRSKVVGKYNKMYYYVHGDTLIIAAFADMRMHPNNIRKAVKG